MAGLRFLSPMPNARSHPRQHAVRGQGNWLSLFHLMHFHDVVRAANKMIPGDHDDAITRGEAAVAAAPIIHMRQQRG